MVPTTAVATDANGVAQVTSWTLGTTAGANTLLASASGPGGPLTGSPLTINANGIAGPATQLGMSVQPPASVASGDGLAPAPVVQLQDANGNPVSQDNVPVTVSLASGTGTLRGTFTRTTNGTGQATFTGLSILGLTGNYTLGFVLGDPDRDHLCRLRSDARGRPPGWPWSPSPRPPRRAVWSFATQPVVQVQDSAGNPVAAQGVTVNAAIASGGGTPRRHARRRYRRAGPGRLHRPLDQRNGRRAHPGLHRHRPHRRNLQPDRAGRRRGDQLAFAAQPGHRGRRRGDSAGRTGSGAGRQRQYGHRLHRGGDPVAGYQSFGAGRWGAP